MCYVAAIPWIIAGIAAVGSVASSMAANKAADAQAKAYGEQNKVLQEEIADRTGNELNERARAARRERAAARVAASESGINLGSNSFLAMLQTSEINQGMDSGLIVRNEKTQQRARQAQYKSNLAGLTKKTGLGIALDATASGASAYMGAGGNMFMGRQPGRG